MVVLELKDCLEGFEKLLKFEFFYLVVVKSYMKIKFEDVVVEKFVGW